MNNAPGGMADFEGLCFSGGALFYLSLNLHSAKLGNGCWFNFCCFAFFFLISSIYLFYAQEIIHLPLSS